MQHIKLWNNCLKVIKDNLEKSIFDTWFRPIESVKFERNILQLRVPSQFFYEYIEEHYVHLLEKAIIKEIGRNVKLEYNVVVDKSNEQKNAYTINIPTQNKSTYTNNQTGVNIEQNLISNPFNIPKLENNHIDPNLNSHYTFDNYIEGDCNRLVTSVAKTISSNPGNSAYNPLFIFGRSGVGKTHISNAIAHEVLKSNPDKTVLYLTANTFRTQYVDASLKNSVNNFLHFYQKIDVLIIDDIHDFIGKTKTQEIFYHIFNHLHQMKKQLILTCDRSLADLDGLSERLISRFKWGLAVKIQIPDFDTRFEILKSKTYRDGIQISNDLLEYIARNLRTNVREIEGFYISLVAHSTLSNKEIDVKLINEILQNFIKRPNSEITIDSIHKSVSSYFKISTNEINSRTRKRKIVQARQIVMHLAKKHTKHSLAEIGNCVGSRKHATVLYALKSVKNLRDTDELFKYDLKKIEEKIGILS